MLSDSTKRKLGAFNKKYASSISNAMRELENAPVEQRKRWPWELIQNACDSIANDPTRKNVDVEINVTQEQVEFIHNGTPFTEEQHMGLIYMYSEGKENNPDTTGQFGTGFCSTHILSRTVGIETNVTDGEKTRRIYQEMHREGKTRDELIKGLDLMDDSLRDVEGDSDLTKFIYKIPLGNTYNRESARFGIEEFIKNIAKVIVFRPYLREAKLVVADDVDFTDLRGEISFICTNKEPITENMTKYTITEERSATGETKYHNFIVSKRENEFNEGDTKHFHYVVSAAIEVDYENHCIVYEESEKRNMVYITFPVLGFEPFEFPVYINSNMFAPLQERNGIHLRGKSGLEPGAEILKDFGKNQIILLESIHLFDDLVSFCAENQMTNIFTLLRGLDPSKLCKELFDIHSFEWYRDNIVVPYQKILLKYPIVNTNEGFKFLFGKEDSASLISYDAEDTEERRITFHNIIESSGIIKNIPSYDDSLKWYSALWDKSHLITVKQLCEMISKEASREKFTPEFLNMFLTFISKYHPMLLNEYPLIPTIKGTFVKQTTTLYECKDIPEVLMQMMDDIESTWTSNHIAYDIENPKLHKHTLSDLVTEISAIIKKKPKNSLLVLRYVPENEKKEYQEKLIQYARELGLVVPTEKYISGIADIQEFTTFWDNSNEVAIKLMLTCVQMKKTMDSVPFNLNDFIKFLDPDQRHNLIISFRVIPNQKKELCKLTDLYEMTDVEQSIINAYQVAKKVEILKTIKLDNFDSVKCTNFYTMKFFIDYFDKNPSPILARELIRILPPRRAPSFEKQASLYHMMCLVDGTDEKPIIIDYADEKIWDAANKIIYITIIQTINKFKTLREMISWNKKIANEESAIDVLNKCYKFVNSEELNVPNRKGIFCSINSVKKSTGIDDNLVKLYKLISEKDLTEELVHSKIKNDFVKEYDQQSFMEVAYDCISRVMDFKNKKNADKIRTIAQEVFGNVNVLEKRDNSLFGKLSGKIIHKLYANRMSNALHEIKSCVEQRKKRWPWELTQNACDSISNDPKRKLINITIKAYDDRIEFIHNGSPFKQDEMVAITYMYSEGKEKNEDATGKFGTGFTSTHVLSRTVEIQANVIGEDGITKRQSITLYREGELMDDLIEGIKRTEEGIHEIKVNKEESDLTKFIYKFSDVTGSTEAADLGIKEFLLNISKEFVFCPKLNCATLYVDEGTKWTDLRGSFTFQRKNSLNINETISEITVSEITVNGEKDHTFIAAKLASEEPKFTAFGAIEVNKESKMIIQSNNAVFLTYPLLGFEKFAFPLIVNSNYFTSTVERTALLLNGPDTERVYSAATKKYTEKQSPAFVNRKIFESMVPIYQTIVTYCSANHYKNMYELLKGLKKNKYVDDLKDKTTSAWFTNKIIIPMRRYVITQNIVWSNVGLRKIYVPQGRNFDIDSNDAILFGQEPKENKAEYAKLISMFIKVHPSIDDMERWSEYIWDNDIILEFSGLIGEIERKGRLKALNIYEQDETAISAMNKLIEYTAKKSIAGIHNQIIPAKSGVFKKPYELKKRGIHKKFLRVVKKNFDIDTDSLFINEEITAFVPDEVYTLKDIEPILNRKFATLSESGYSNENCFEVAKEIFPMTSPFRGVREKQALLIETYDLVFKTRTSPIESDFITDVIFNHTFNYIIYNINAKLLSFGSISKIAEECSTRETNVLNTLSTFYKLIPILKDIDKYKFVLPNIKGDFTPLESLKVCVEEDQSNKELLSLYSLRAPKVYKKVSIDKDFLEFSKLVYGGDGWESILLHPSLDMNIVQQITIDELCSELEENLMAKWNKQKSKLPKKSEKIFSFLLFNIIKKQNERKSKGEKVKEIFPKLNGIFSEIYFVLTGGENSASQAENQLMKSQLDEAQSKVVSLQEQVLRLQRENNSLRSQNSALTVAAAAQNSSQTSSRYRLPSRATAPRAYNLPTFTGGFAYHPQRFQVIQNLQETSSTTLYKACAFLYEYLKDSDKFDSVEICKLTVKPNEKTAVKFNKTQYYVNKEQNSRFDIHAQCSDGFEFFITVRATNVSVGSNNEIPIDIHILNEISKEISEQGGNDQSSSQNVLAVVWGSEPSIESTIFFSNSKINEILFSH